MTTAVSTIKAFDGNPKIVHISDVHGYLEDARSALRAVGETAAFDPVVTTDDDGLVHWADNDYVLVINGDLIDRGPSNAECLELVWRLQRKAPEGRVRYHIGNHEMAILLPGLVRWPQAFSTNLDPEERHSFLERIIDGTVSAAFEGYEYLYSHAGRNTAFSAAEVNEELRDVASTLIAGDEDDSLHRRIESEHSRVFGIGDSHGGRGPNAGLCWMDFAHLEASAPPQIVGHTKRSRPVRDGNVVCGNVIRMNQGTVGGEGVLIEDESGLTAVHRDSHGDVSTTTV